MNGQNWTDEERDDPITAEHAEDQPARALGLRPALMFGLRAAALAGLVVSVGAAAAGISGVFDDPTVVANPTTCCWPDR